MSERYRSRWLQKYEKVDKPPKKVAKKVPTNGEDPTEEGKDESKEEQEPKS